nr:MAG TPA: hypothetical protein [Caudoviricetes sp.]
MKLSSNLYIIYNFYYLLLTGFVSNIKRLPPHCL